MGQAMSTIVGYIIVFCLRLQEKAKSLFSSGKQNDSGKYFNHDILLKDEEQSASKL